MMRMRALAFLTALMLLVLASSSRPALAYTYVHEVLPGERLKRIAQRYHTTVERIRRRNRLRRGHLRAGRKLKIVTSVPSRIRRRVLYVVRKGDSLSRVAKKHKMKTWVLRRINASRLRKRRVLRPGMRLWVVVEGAAPSGGVKGLYLLRAGPGYRVRSAKRSWGTFLAISRIHDVLGDYARHFRRAPPIHVMDLSMKGGGRFPPHKSHRSGRDVDIPYPLKAKYAKFHTAAPSRLHLRRAWWLVKRFLKTNDVTFIFMDYPLQRALYTYAKHIGESKTFLAKVFQYPRGRRVLQGIIRDEPGHDTHFHVRFRKEHVRKKGKRVRVRVARRKKTQ